MSTIRVPRRRAICRFINMLFLSASVIGPSYHKVTNNDKRRIFDLHREVGATLTGHRLEIAQLGIPDHA